MGGNSLKEWKNQEKQHFFLWTTYKLPSLPRKTKQFDANIIWEKSEENNVQRKKRKQKKKKEKKRKGRKGKKKKGEISVRFSRARVCVRAFQPQCCFFAVTSVTRREENRRKFDRKVRKWGEIEEKQRGKMCFSLWFRVLFKPLPHYFVKIHSKTTGNHLEDNDLSISLWHLWQQKDKTPCQCARTRAREKACL